MKREIKNFETVSLMVDLFYTDVRNDKLIGPVFSEVIGDNWTAHLEKMYRFWDSILFGSATYKGNPFDVHKVLPINEIHFSRWISLFKASIERNFEGEVAENALEKAQFIARVFEGKLKFLRTEGLTSNQ